MKPASLAGLTALLVVGVGILWGILFFAIGNVRNDVKAIRDSIGGLQKADAENIDYFRDLTEQVGGLRTDLATFSDKLDNAASKFELSANNLTNRMSKLRISNARRARYHSHQKGITKLMK